MQILYIITILTTKKGPLKALKMRVLSPIIMLLSLEIIFLPVFAARDCPPWMYRDDSGSCRCGQSLRGLVYCDSQTEKVSVLFCYCMTRSSRSNLTTVGNCLPMCYYENLTHCNAYTTMEYDNGATVSNNRLNAKNCGPFNRTGQLCGECSDGLGFPVYSYSTLCVPCSSSKLGVNVAKYFFMAFFPLTVFYIILMVSTISITAPGMLPFVLFCQLFSTPTILKALMRHNKEGVNLLTVIITFASMWNLDFFRSIYRPFCLHPKLSAMAVIAMDYLITLYPMLLIVISYFAIALYDRRPARQLTLPNWLDIDIRGSLMQTFVAFIIMSYVKILQVSFDLLTPVRVYQMDGSYSYYLSIAGEIPYFSSEHTPYGVLAIAMLAIFNLAPLITIMTYTNHCFPCPYSHHVLSTAADILQGCYRQKPRYCRYYFTVHFVVRILHFFFVAFSKYIQPPPYVGFLILAQASLAAVIKPYKKNVYNRIEVVMCTLIAAFMFSLVTEKNYVRIYEPQVAGEHAVNRIIGTLGGTVSGLLLLYGSLVIGSQILPRRLREKFTLIYTHDIG